MANVTKNDPVFSIDRDVRDGLIHQCSNRNCYWVARTKEPEPKCPQCGKRMIRLDPFGPAATPVLKGGL